MQQGPTAPHTRAPPHCETFMDVVGREDRSDWAQDSAGIGIVRAASTQPVSQKPRSDAPASANDQDGKQLRSLAAREGFRARCPARQRARSRVGFSPHESSAMALVFVVARIDRNTISNNIRFPRRLLLYVGQASISCSTENITVARSVAAPIPHALNP